MMTSNVTTAARLSAIVLAASLAACGGGGTDSTASPAPDLTPATPGTPANAGTAGTLPTLQFVNTGASSTQNVVITGSGMSSVMTFNSPAFTLTGATSSNPTWSSNGGFVRADGNVVVYCAAGRLNSPTPNSNTADVPYLEGGKIYLSTNVAPVTDLTEFKKVGVKTTQFDCAGNISTNTYNADGTVTLADNTGATTLTAAQAAQFNSDAGFTAPGGSNYKSRAYKIQQFGVARYFVVTTVNQVNPTAKYVTLSYQTN